MSGADDQRGAEPDQCRYCPNDADRDEAGFLHCIECRWTDNPGKIVELCESLDGLRAELAETRDRRDYLQGQLDIIYDAEYSRNDALLRRIEKMGAAGDALAGEVTAMLTGPVPDSGGWWSRLAPKVDAWRSVRGDAPTQPPAAGVSVPQKSTESPAVDTAAPDPVVGYVLARLDLSAADTATLTLWDDDVRASRSEVQIAHAEHVDDPPEAGWRCYELRDVCTPPAGGSAPASTDGDQR